MYRAGAGSPHKEGFARSSSHPDEGCYRLGLVASLILRQCRCQATASIMGIVYEYLTIQSEHDHAVGKKSDLRLPQLGYDDGVLFCRHILLRWMKHTSEMSWLLFSRVVL